MIKRNLAFCFFSVVVVACSPPEENDTCDGNSDCDESTPFCVDAPGGTCVECLEDSDCDDGETCDAVDAEGEGTGSCEAA